MKLVAAWPMPAGTIVTAYGHAFAMGDEAGYLIAAGVPGLSLGLLARDVFAGEVLDPGELIVSGAVAHDPASPDSWRDRTPLL